MSKKNIIIELEIKLTDNEKKIKVKQSKNEFDVEFRELLFRRSVLKDQLLDAYRKAMTG